MLFSPIRRCERCDDVATAILNDRPLCDKHLRQEIDKLKQR
jgi:hypothetical protein